MVLDDDITAMDLVTCQRELQKLRDSLREHRDAEGHERCQVTVAALFALLPERKLCRYNIVLDVDEFLGQCRRFHTEELHAHLKLKGLLPCGLPIPNELPANEQT